MDVSSLVRSIVSSFEDAINMVKRMQDRKTEETNLQTEAIEDLIDSLSLGPIVVRGYYESDARRYGAAYTSGDSMAREQLKDALINLQMTVLSGLGTILLDDKIPDFDAIQAASDDCRVNVGVCLGQLSQRLSESSKSLSHGKFPMYGANSSGLNYSDSRSTQSSGRSRITPMTPPESDGEYLMERSALTPSRRKYSGRSSEIDDMSGLHKASYNGLYSRSPDNQSLNPPMLSRQPSGGFRPSSRGVEPPTSPQEYLPSTSYRSARTSMVSNATGSTRSDRQDSQQNQPSRAMFAMDFNHGEEPDSWRYYEEPQPQQPKPRTTSLPASDLDPTARNRMRESVNTVQSQPVPVRKTQSPLYLFPKVPSTASVPTYARQSIPEESPIYYEKPTPPPTIPLPPIPQAQSRISPQPQVSPLSQPQSPPPPQPQSPPPPQPQSSPPPQPQPQPQPQFQPQSHFQPQQQQQEQPQSQPQRQPQPQPQPHLELVRPVTPVRHHSDSTTNGTITVGATPSLTAPSVVSLQRIPTGPLMLPTDKNMLGFCKGAFRLQAGMEKKAFKVANRPVGYSSMIQYWQCDKCNFEGPLSNVIPPGQKKAEKVFDNSIRDHGGVRYKWVFLAKSHIQLKSMPEGRRDGSFGSYACIFCTAEAAMRGWPVGSQRNSSVAAASIRSSNSGSSNQSTTVFGNIHALMDHLQMHRQQEFWPGVEMQGRTKCIVGRVADRGEDFEINLLPL